jgi:CRP-like cAMP-binding protein
MAALASSSIFGALDPAALASLAASGHLVALEHGATLFLRGEEGDAAYVVLDGELEVRALSEEGRELRIAALAGGAVVGEMSVLDGAARSADVVGARRSTLWRLPRAAVLAALRDHPEAAIALMIELSGRLRAANARLELVSRRRLENQLAALLVAEQNRQGVVAMAQTEMARRIGFSREKVNRQLHRWSATGWLALERRGVRLLQSEALRQLAP